MRGCKDIGDARFSSLRTATNISVIWFECDMKAKPDGSTVSDLSRVIRGWDLPKTGNNDTRERRPIPRSGSIQAYNDDDEVRINDINSITHEFLEMNWWWISWKSYLHVKCNQNSFSRLVSVSKHFSHTQTFAFIILVTWNILTILLKDRTLLPSIFVGIFLLLCSLSFLLLRSLVTLIDGFPNMFCIILKNREL